MQGVRRRGPGLLPRSPRAAGVASPTGRVRPVSSAGRGGDRGIGHGRQDGFHDRYDDLEARGPADDPFELRRGVAGQNDELVWVPADLGVLVARQLDRRDALLLAALADVAVEGRAEANLGDLLVDAARSRLVDRALGARLGCVTAWHPFSLLLQQWFFGRRPVGRGRGAGCGRALSCALEEAEVHGGA